MNADELKKELREQARKWWFETPEIALDFMIDELLVPIAEPREKRIAELTEQNTSLLTSVENLNKTVQELEKENAELKTRVSEQSERISELTQELDDKINRFE